MINTAKLKARIMESGYSQRSLARDMGMGINALNEKINGKSPFNVDQVLKICNLCHIDTAEEKVNIFLLQPSQK